MALDLEFWSRAECSFGTGLSSRFPWAKLRNRFRKNLPFSLATSKFFVAIDKMREGEEGKRRLSILARRRLSPRFICVSGGERAEAEEEAAAKKAKEERKEKGEEERERNSDASGRNFSGSG